MGDSLRRQQELIKRAREVLEADARVLAAHLIGSHAAGVADDYSDVDVHCVVADAEVDAFLADADRLLRDIAGPLVLVDAIPGVSGVLALSADWQHIDLVVHTETEYDPARYEAVAPMFDRTGSLLRETTAPDRVRQPIVFPIDAVNLFFYFLGKLVTVLGRDELVVAHSGIVASRGQLVKLMYAESGIRAVGGVKRLNPFLSHEQRAVLEAIPAAGADRNEIIEANRYMTARFIERGKRLAEKTGAAWPQGLQDATLAHLHRHLDVDFSPTADAGIRPAV